LKSFSDMHLKREFAAWDSSRISPESSLLFYQIQAFLHRALGQLFGSIYFILQRFVLAWMRIPGSRLEHETRRASTMRARSPLCVIMIILSCAVVALEQDTPAAKATRKKLQQKITIDFKEVGTKAAFDEIKGEMDPPVSFKIDNASGISNNAKLNYITKDKSVEQILNELSDKFDFGWFVKSDAKDRND